MSPSPCRPPSRPPPPPGPLCLCGFPGSGKTTVGESLAASLGVPFLDTDRLVLARFGKGAPDVASLVLRDGWPAFRARERLVLAGALAAGPSVAALGGGALREDTLGMVLAAPGAVLVHLDAPLALCLERARRDARAGRRRPALDVPPERIRRLHAARSALHRRARATVPIDAGMAPAVVCEAVLKALGQIRAASAAGGPVSPYHPQGGTTRGEDVLTHCSPAPLVNASSVARATSRRCFDALLAGALGGLP